MRVGSSLSAKCDRSLLKQFNSANVLCATLLEQCQLCSTGEISILLVATVVGVVTFR